MSAFHYGHNTPILSPFVYKHLKIGLLSKDLGTQFRLREQLAFAHVRVGWTAGCSLPLQELSAIIQGIAQMPIRPGSPAGQLQTHVPRGGPMASPAISDLGTRGHFAYSNEFRHFGEETCVQSSSQWL